MKDVEDSASALEFGLYINTNALGLRFSIPITPTLLAGFPLGPAVGGTVTVSCKVKLSDIGITCGVGYDEPAWLSAFFNGLHSGAKKVLGAVSGGVDDAKKAAEETWESTVGGAVPLVDNAFDDVTDVANEIGAWATGVASLADPSNWGPAVGDTITDITGDIAGVTDTITGLTDV